MESSYRRIGEFITVLDTRNTDGMLTNLTGISITKNYIPSVANVLGTDLTKYKVISKGQFSCSLMQVSRDGRIPIAMYTDDEPAIMSPAYVLFEVTNTDEILPEYLELWFKRAEFDREACFYAVGGVRGSLEWDDFCNMKLPVPDISVQRKIVHDYKVVTDRIELLKKINENLENVIKATYRKLTTECPGEKTVFVTSDFCDIFTGKKDVNQAATSGNYHFYSCSPEPYFSNDYIYSGRAILVAGNGSYTGRVTYVDEPFDLYQRTYAITPKCIDDERIFILYAGMQTQFQAELESKLHGSAIPYIVNGDLANFTMEVDKAYEPFAHMIHELLDIQLKNNREITILGQLKSTIMNSMAALG